MIGILIFSSGIAFSYIILISRYVQGWNNTPVFNSKNCDPDINASVIIAFRNEEKNLPVLFKALQEQSYPRSAFEIIFADDHSEDRSANLVRGFILTGGNARLVELKKSETGKKKALAAASIEAQGELLLFTDADCRPGKDWIKTIVSCYLEKSPVLIASPVIIMPEPGFFSRFQSLEFISLIGSTAGAFGIQKPIMVNGANLAIEKEIYLENLNFIETRTSSGDDMFFLLQLKKKYPGKLIFLKSPGAIVTSKPEPGLIAFIMQRFRWVSKSKYYSDKDVIIAALIVLLINLWLLSCFILSFFSTDFIFIGGVVFLAKSVIDYIFLRKVLFFFRMESLLKIFVLSQFLYFLYISFTGIAGFFMPSKWKGRAVK
jgi:cellulose synthase/poly-beta-1,6-N-acetylglucosamine synthase-like glycosyltransferase